MVDHYLVKKLILHIATIFLTAAVTSSLFFGAALAGDRPFSNSTNWGGTGLIEMPNARILEDGVLRFGVSQVEPHRFYSGSMGVLPRVEFGGWVTETRNVTVSEVYGNHKDKAFSVKLQVIKESKYLPAISIGANDFHGTRLFASEYLAISRKIAPFDITLGIGSKRYSGGSNLFGIDDIGAFGGIEWNISNRFNFIAEYCPIEYEKNPALQGIQPIPKSASSKINLGVRAEIFRGVDLSLSWQRGDELGVNLNFNVLLGKSIIPKQPNPPAWRTLEPDTFVGQNTTQRLNIVQAEIKEAGFDNVKVYIYDQTLTAEFQNERYISNQKAAGRILRILLKHASSDIEHISAVLTRRKIPFLRVTVDPKDFDQYLMGKMREDIFEQLVVVETISEKSLQTEHATGESDKDERLAYNWGIKPEFEPFLNDLSGAFRFRVGIKPYVTVSPWKGSEFLAAYMIPFYSNVQSQNVPPPDAVRSDGWKYLGDDPSLDRLYYDQTFRLGDRTLGRFSTGYLEKQYAGFSGEAMTFPGKGDFAIGVEYDLVQKRVPGNTLELISDRDYYTFLGNLYYRFKPLKMTLRAQYGRFLGADVGWRFEASREYEHGVVVGAWYSFTDTDHFLTPENQGYNDKGVFMRLPAQMFSLREKRTRYYYSLAPWTRDVAATVLHPSSLYDIGHDLMPALFEEELGKLKK